MQKRIAIYGASGNGRRFHDALSKSGKQVAFFIDRYSDAKEVCGHPVYRPESVPAKDVVVHVAVDSHSTRIAKELRSDGFSCVYDFNQSVGEIDSLIDQYLAHAHWYSADASAMVDVEKIALFDALSTDDKSRELTADDCCLQNPTICRDLYPQ